MRISSKHFLGSTLVIAFCLAALASPHLAAEKKKNKAVSMFLAAAEKTAQLKDYHVMFLYTEYDPKEKKNKTRTCEFWWKEPGLRKLIVHEGENSGSVVSFNPKKNKKKVFGKKNGISIPGGLPANNPLVAPFFEVGWQNDFKNLKSLAKDGAFSLAGEEKIRGKDAVKIKISLKEGEYNGIIVWLDKEDGWLLKHEYYKDNKFDHSTEFYGVEVDTELKDSTFEP